MGAAEKPNHHHHHHHHHMVNFSFHLHGHESPKKDVPKGCLGVMVGQGEERQRFVIPVMYVNHPLFEGLLREAEKEFGFDQKGPISIPCQVEEFRSVQDLIDRDRDRVHLTCRHQVGCFGV